MLRFVVNEPLGIAMRRIDSLGMRLLGTAFASSDIPIPHHHERTSRRAVPATPGAVRGFHVPLEKYAGLGACYRPGSMWATRTQALRVLPASNTSESTTYACCRLRSLSQIQISSPYQPSSTDPVCGYQEGTPLTNCAPHDQRRASLHCQGSS